MRKVVDSMKIKHLQLIPGNQLKVKNRSLLQWGTFLVAFWSVLFKPISLLPGPLSYLKYLPDGIILILLLLSLGKSKIKLNKSILVPVGLVLGFFSYALLVYLFQFQSIAYFLWGFRNNFRFYIAFFAFIAFLDTKDVETWFRAMDVLFWINAALSLIQFFALGLRGDFLGGIFGVVGGSNGFTMLFMSIVVSRALLLAFNGSASVSKAYLKCIVSILLAAMAEMKLYFVVVILILVGAAMLSRFSFKKILTLLFIIAAVMYGAAFLAQLFGHENFLTFESLFELATKDNYSEGNDVNRLSAIPSLCQKLDLNPIQQIFGLGLGNCDLSGFAICNTPFYVQYGYLHYTWFTAAMIFLETGYLGLTVYVGFFVCCGLFANKCRRKKTGNILCNQMVILITILCFVLVSYNSSLRIESGYMVYFVMALPFIYYKAESTGAHKKE